MLKKCKGIKTFSIKYLIVHEKLRFKREKRTFAEA